LRQHTTLLIPRSFRTEFGSITVDGKTYEHDVIIRLSGKVEKRRKRLSKQKYGTSHIISKGKPSSCSRTVAIYVGKQPDDHELPQGEISALLVKLAREGKRVALSSTASAGDGRPPRSTEPWHRAQAKDLTSPP
jgi:hypothetical protein